MKKTKTIGVYCSEATYCRDWPPEKPMEFKAWLDNKLSVIPPEFMDSASICISSYEAYGESYPKVEIYYERPETDNEYRQRLDIEAAQKENQEQREKSLYLELKRKFGEL